MTRHFISNGFLNPKTRPLPSIARAQLTSQPRTLSRVPPPPRRQSCTTTPEIPIATGYLPGQTSPQPTCSNQTITMVEEVFQRYTCSMVFLYCTRTALMYQLFSHAVMISQCYEQFWYKPIPHDFEKLILNQWSLNNTNN